MKLLPGLVAGEDIAKRRQAAIQRTIHLHLPARASSRIPALYIEMDGTEIDGTGVPTPIAHKETEE